MGKNKIDRLSGFCIITGASSGIGLELAKLAAKDGCSLLLVADRDLAAAQAAAESSGAAEVQTLETDLATREGVERLVDTVGTREAEVLMAMRLTDLVMPSTSRNGPRSSMSSTPTSREPYR